MSVSFQDKPESKIFYGWIIVAVLLIAGAVLLGTRQSYGVFFKSVQSDFNLSRAATSGIFSVYMGFSGVFSVLGGWALDKFGPKWTIASMGFFTGLSLLLTSQIHSLWQLYFTYSLILAIGTGETYTVVSASVSRWFHKKRGLALGISQAGGGIGLLLTAPLSSYLIINFDWRTAYVVLGIVALTFVIGPAMLLKGSPKELGLIPDGGKLNSPSNGEANAEEAKVTALTFNESLRTKQFWFLFLIWLLHGTASYVVTTHIVPHATDLGISALAAATILSVFALFNIIGGLVVGTLSDHLGRKVISIICAVIGAGAMFLLIGIAGNIWLFYIFAALFGIAFGGISTVVSALAGDVFGILNLGKIMGWIGIAWFSGATIGSFIGGIIHDIYGSYFLAFLIAAVSMLIVIVLLTLVTKSTIVDHLKTAKVTRVPF